jgi:hypothetical protein
MAAVAAVEEIQSLRLAPAERVAVVAPVLE